MNKSSLTDEFLYEYIPRANKLSDEINEERNKSIPDHVFSAKYERNIKKMIKKYSRSPRQITIRKSIAVALITMLLLNALLVACIPSYMEKVFNIVVTVYEEFTSIFTQVDDEPLDEMEHNFIQPSYIPEGFVIDEVIAFDHYFKIYYVNENLETIIYEQELIVDSEKLIDTENVDIQMFKINNIEYSYFYNKDMYNIYWYNDNYKFSLKASIELNEIKKIIKEIKN